MDKSQLLKLSKSVRCDYDIGVWSEINSFIEYQGEKISDFTLSYNKIEKYYDLKILMFKFDEQEAQNIFHRLVEFIEYKGATFYTKEENDDSIEYFFLSSSRSYKGLLLRIEIFRKSRAGKRG